MRYQDGLKIATHIFEAAAWQYSITATCRSCGHTGIFSPHGLWWLFHRKGWDDRLTVASARFRCVDCGKAGADLTLGREDPTITRLPMPDKGEWKRAINRFRC